jgi:peptidoglycan/xylan/chitin deacetylase (PgdA/CDA1 family)
MKQIALKLMHSSGAFAPFRFLNRHKTLILMYHRFSDREDGISTSASDFEAHLKYLKEHYNVLSLGQAVTKFRTNGNARARDAVITIDDGYRDAYKVALPLLRKYQMPATIFVVTGFLDRKVWLWTDKLRFALLETKKQVCEYQTRERLIKLELSDRRSRIEGAAKINSYLKNIPDEEKEEVIQELAQSLQVSAPESPPAEFEALTWDELRKLEEGGIEIGSHTHTHPILTQVALDRVGQELRTSKARLEEMLSHEVPLFCYPNGINNREIREETRVSGYKAAVTATPGFSGAEDDIFMLSRIAADPDLPHFVQNTSGFELFKNSVRTQRPYVL